MGGTETIRLYDSVLAADLHFFYHHSSNKDPELPTAVLEVGFSQPYDELVARAKTWIRGGCRSCFLLKIEEDPPYKSPIDPLAMSDEFLSEQLPPPDQKILAKLSRKIETIHLDLSK